MKDINDLLLEISSSNLAKKSDVFLSMQDKFTKWSYEEIYPIWVDHYHNKTGRTILLKKYGICFRVFETRCNAYNLPLTSCKEDEGKKRVLSNPRQLDIINGMKPKEWAEKYGAGIKQYWNYKKRLKKYGLI